MLDSGLSSIEHRVSGIKYLIRRSIMFASLTNPKLYLLVAVVAFVGPLGASTIKAQQHKYNEVYRGPYLNRVAFPIGGIGAGMVCLEGTGAISHLSVRNRMQVFNEPCSFAALCIKRL